MSCVINCSDIVDGSSQCSWSGECILVASDVEGGVREAFVFQFLHHLKLKTLALSKYVDAVHTLLQYQC